MGQWFHLALFAVAAVGCTGPNPAFMLVTTDGSTSPPAEVLPDSPTREAGVGDSVPEPTPADGPFTSPEADPTPDAPAPDTGAPAVDSALDIAAPPPRLVFESIAGTKPYGGDGGFGTWQSTTGACGADQVLIGFVGHATTTSTTSTPLVARLEGRCGRLGITPAPPYRVTVTPVGPPHPASIGPIKGNSFSAMCKADQVLVGFYGREGYSLDQVGFKCAPLSIDMGPPATLVRGPTDVPLGPWPVTNGGMAFGEECGASLGVVGVANEYFVRHGNWIYEVELHCKRPRLAP